jgi:hypothetical protein
MKISRTNCSVDNVFIQVDPEYPFQQGILHVGQMGSQVFRYRLSKRNVPYALPEMSGIMHKALSVVDERNPVLPVRGQR